MSGEEEGRADGPPPTIAERRPEVVTRQIPAWREGWTTAATSADHKVVAKLFMGTSLSFLAIAALAFALTRIQLIVPDSTIIRPDIFSQMSTTAMTSITVLFGVPFVLGLLGYIVPLQIGARGVALPRLNQLAYWLYAAGTLVFFVSFLYLVPEIGALAAAATLGRRVLALGRRRRLDRRRRPRDPGLHLLGDQHDRDAQEHARAGHGVAPRAGARIGRPGHLLHRPHHRGGDGGRARDARDRPQPRRRLLRRRPGRRADALRPPQLALLHRHPHRHGRRRARGDLRDRPDLLAQAALQPLRRDGIAGRRRRPGNARLDAEPLREPARRGLRVLHDARRGPAPGPDRPHLRRLDPDDVGRRGLDPRPAGPRHRWRRRARVRARRRARDLGRRRRAPAREHRRRPAGHDPGRHRVRPRDVRRRSTTGFRRSRAARSTRGRPRPPPGSSS